MKSDQHLIAQPWKDYELIDSGENMKLERFGAVTLARPETQALWAKRQPERWSEAQATFAFRDAKGAWETRGSVPESWPVTWGEATLAAKLTGFKHTGIFPEQAPNWEWLQERMRGFVNPSSDEGFTKPLILNLFGYTGAATAVAARADLRLAGAGSGHAKAGAHVTHVDASKQSLDWAHENARASGVGEDQVRWILDDALAFVKREVRRSATYDGIILDPPAFGRGAKGEVWKIEESLPELLASLKELLNDASGSFFLMSGYAAGYSPRSFAQAVESAFVDVNGESGEMFIKESGSERVVPAGIYVRFVR